MKRTIPCLVICIVLFFFAAGLNETPLRGKARHDATPALETTSPVPSQRGSVENESIHVFWFLHVTDTQDCWRSDEKTTLFRQFVNETFTTIDPVFVVHTGDIVDTNYTNFHARDVGQWDMEWNKYRQAIDDYGMNLSCYVDLMGNHDAYGDPGFTYYRNNSVLGRATGQLQYTWNYYNGAGNFTFIGIHTPEEAGVEFPFEVWGSMDTPQLDWLESRLAESDGSTMTFLFGHHPILDIVHMASSAGTRLETMIARHGVDAMFHGHYHEATSEIVPEYGGLRQIQTPIFDDGGGSYRIVAVDGTTLSSRVASVQAWPQGIITNPVAIDHVYGTGANVPAPDEIDSVRVLAWDPLGIAGVDVRVDGGSWAIATNVQGPLWVASWNPALAAGADHVIEARITGNSDEQVIQVVYNSQPPIAWTWSYLRWFILGTVGIAGLVVFLTAWTAYRRLAPSSKFKKTADENVDGRLKVIFLIKCALLLAVPMASGLMIGDQLTLAFGLFLVSTSPAGIHFYVLNMLITAALFGTGIVWSGLCMSARKQREIIAPLITSAAMAGYLLTFYVLRYAIALFSPGLIAWIACDIFMMRRAVQMEHEIRKRNGHPV
nr:metallophosphoesterase [Candidatus Sigynarchaeota archaeon]